MAMNELNEPEYECSDVLRDVWLFLDDEMNPANRAAVEAHLERCSPCLEEAGVEQKLKALLHRSCGGDRAPEHLRSLLAARLQSVQITTGNEQGDQLTVTTTTWHAPQG